MLYILTGAIQTGKTRWLQCAINLLEQNKVRCEGVIAPGIWHVEDEVYIKDGISNELLPDHDSLVFGMRANSEGTNDNALACSQAHKAGLGWMINDDAIATVNRHFASLAKNVGAQTKSINPCFLIVDELGILELKRNEGLTSALSLLSKGSMNYYDHAIVVVREKDNLHEIAANLFGDVWRGYQVINPHDISPDEWIESLHLQHTT